MPHNAATTPADSPSDTTTSLSCNSATMEEYSTEPTTSKTIVNGTSSRHGQVEIDPENPPQPQPQTAAPSPPVMNEYVHHSQHLHADEEEEGGIARDSVRSIGSELKGLAKRITRQTSAGQKHNNNNKDNDKESSNQKQQPFSIPPATKAPKETLKAVYAAGKYKAGLTLDVLSVQSFMAGIYIAAAGHLYLAVGGGVLGSALFPFGLIAVILTSAELFTGDALIFVAAVLGKQVKFRYLLRNWTVAWCSNFVGCLCWAIFLGYLSDALVDSKVDDLAVSVAEKKALNHLGHIFLKAIGANFMVCVAVWQGTTAEEVAGKCLALWFPTAAFVMMGFDHVVANMYLIPQGMLLGANVSVGRMFAALAVATLGNAVGGGFFVGFIYWYVFDSMSSFTGLTARIRANLRPNLKSMGSRSFRASGHHNRGPPKHLAQLPAELAVAQQEHDFLHRNSSNESRDLHEV